MRLLNSCNKRKINYLIRYIQTKERRLSRRNLLRLKRSFHATYWIRIDWLKTKKDEKLMYWCCMDIPWGKFLPNNPHLFSRLIIILRVDTHTRHAGGFCYTDTYFALTALFRFCPRLPIFKRLLISTVNSL